MENGANVANGLHFLRVKLRAGIFMYVSTYMLANGKILQKSYA